MEAFVCTGLWWLPEKPADKVAGVLSYEADAAIKLSLFGVLGEATGGLQEKPMPVIVGVVYDYKLTDQFTLTDCRRTSLQFGSFGLRREEYSCDRAFACSHLENEEDFLFSESEISLSGLSSWADALRGLRISYNDTERSVFNVEWSPQRPLEGSVPGGTLSLSVRAQMRSSRREGRIKETVRLAVASDESLSEHDFTNRFVRPLRNFFTFATDHPNALTKYILRKKEHRAEVHVFAPVMFHEAKAAEDLFPHKMLFSLADIDDRCIPIMAKWFDLSSRQQSMCNVYFSAFYKPARFLETEFLSVVQSLELYQRHRDGSSAPASEAAEATLPSQLSGLLAEHSDTILPLFGMDVQDAVKRIWQLRSQILHYADAGSIGREYNKELYWFVERLRFLTKACFLAELGISKGEQIKFLHRNQLYRHILGLAGK